MNGKIDIQKKHSACFYIKELQNLFSFDAKKQASFSISTDSRNIDEEEVFLPLVGEKFDGHDFINEVLNKGVEHSFCESNKLTKVKEDYKPKLIFVNNTLDAYHKIANYYRRKINPKVITITGSSGKTTMKDLVSTVLAKRHKVHKTEANFNNEFGIPRTILEMPPDSEILILELAMRKEGEIKYLAKTSEPDIAVITNVGTAHIGMLGSKNSIIKAKCEILEYLKSDGLAVLCNDPPLIQYSQSIWKGKTATFDLSQVDSISFTNDRSFFSFERENYFVSALGRIHILNSICAIILAKHLSLTKDEIQNGLSEFTVPRGRGSIVKLTNDIYLVDESYNANPDSLKAAVSNLVECWGNKYKKILVLGELAELGNHEDKLLTDLGGWLLDKPLSNVITVGDKLKQITFATNVADIHECCAILKGLMKPGTVILVKGSHVAGLEKVIKYFGT